MYAQAYNLLRQGSLDLERHSLLNLYHRSLDRGRRGGVWSWLLGRSRRLLDLKEIEAAFVSVLKGVFHPRVKYPEPVKVRSADGREVEV